MWQADNHIRLPAEVMQQRRALQRLPVLCVFVPKIVSEKSALRIVMSVDADGEFGKVDL